MKKLILAALLLNGCHAVPAYAAEPETLCEVKVCNKLERLTLDPFKMIGDSMGEQCFNVTLPKKEAVEGKVLSSESRWYQGSFNPTKQSVTRVKHVIGCRTL